MTVWPPQRHSRRCLPHPAQVLALRPATVAITRRRVVLVLLAPLALWLAVMWPRKHKVPRWAGR